MLSTTSRKTNYLKQNGNRSLTPAQKRRIKHKEGHSLQRIRRLAESKSRRRITTKELLTKAVDRVAEESAKPICPTCDAVLDERCRTKDGKPTRRHKGRPE